MSLALVTLVSRAVELQYPIIPVIRSAFSIVDEIIVNVDVGPGPEDWNYIVCHLDKMDPHRTKRIVPVAANWDWNAHDAGKEFVRQTNRTFDFVQSDWILNLQADEVIHEDDYEDIKWITTLPEEYTGAALNRLYFWKDLQTIRTDWTQDLVRMIRRGKGRSAGDSIQCVSDGLTWPTDEGTPRIFHYTRIGDPVTIGARIYANDLMHHAPEELDSAKPYTFKLQSVDGHLSGRSDRLPELSSNRLVRYEGTHPAAIREWKF